MNENGMLHVNSDQATHGEEESNSEDGARTHTDVTRRGSVDGHHHQFQSGAVGGVGVV
jgi:hypothetical protein